MTIKSDNIQIGQNATATQNFVLKQGADGTCTLARGNVGATTQDILTVDAAGKTTFPLPPIYTQYSMVRLNTANGYGSTNTKIRRFTNVVTNVGSDITYADSAANGASFTINTSGVYAISYNDQFTSTGHFGLSLNTTQPTVAIAAIPIAEILQAATSPAANLAGFVSNTVYLPAGSVIRAHCDTLASGTAVALCQFTITRVS